MSKPDISKLLEIGFFFNPFDAPLHGQPLACEMAFHRVVHGEPVDEHCLIGCEIYES